MKNRLCPVCEGLNNKFLFHQKFSSISNGTLLDSYDVVCCESCGFSFANNIPDQEIFDTYYEAFSKYESVFDGKYTESQFDKKRFEIICSYIFENNIERSANILDIGCSTGFFLNILKNAGFHSVKGIDPSDNCSKIAKDYYNIQVYTGNVNHLDNIGSKFDLIVMIGVLEHIRDLDITLKRLYDSLNIYGKLLIVVPDASNYYLGVDASFQEFSIEHINYFGPISLENLLKKNRFVNKGFKQVMFEVNNNTITPGLLSLFEKSPNTNNFDFKYDYVLVENLVKYILKSELDEKSVFEKIKLIIEAKINIYIWGTGAQTLSLLEKSNLSTCKILSFIDSNTKYHGNKINGISIIGPNEIIDQKATIIISTRAYQDQIEKYIIEDLKLPNNIIKLY
jgi:SAM-dependent methyltransferase